MCGATRDVRFGPEADMYQPESPPAGKSAFIPPAAFAWCSAIRRVDESRSLVAMHGGVRFGIAHEQVDHQRNADHAGEIIIEPLFVADRFEPQRD
jgi:hypothetical protein